MFTVCPRPLHELASFIVYANLDGRPVRAHRPHIPVQNPP